MFDGDANLVSFVQRAVGYSLTGDTREECLFLLHGSGANGKTTFLNVIRALLGDHSRSARAETFLSAHQGGIPNDLADLRGLGSFTRPRQSAGHSLPWR